MRSVVIHFLKILRQNRTLNHPNIARFIGAEIKPTEVYIFLEFYSNGSLYKLLHDDKRNLSIRVYLL
jgi:serine/threonine protein kinase